MARTSRKNIDTPVAEQSFTAKTYNAAAYIRLSSDDTKKRGDSLETQRNIIENYIAANSGLRLVEVYSDNNMTGTNFERPGFQRMLADAESGKINCICVKDLTRFGRSIIDSGYYLHKHLPSLGVRFIAITDNYDSNEGDGGIMLPLQIAIAESYALDISRKCRAVQRQNIADGRFVGRMAPYGYTKSPYDCRKLIIDETAAITVCQIYNWATQNLTAGEIVRRLNAAKTLTPSRYKQSLGLITSNTLIGFEQWNLRTIRGILCDQVYVGDMVQGKTRTVNHKEIAVPESEWVCVPNTHAPIISREQFAIVQQLRADNSEQDAARRHSKGAYTPNVFGGKVICAKCGHPMHRHRQNKDGTYWFRCESTWKYSKDSCTVVSVKEAELKTEIIAMLHKHSEVILGRFLSLDNTQSANTETLYDAELREINANLDKGGKVLKRLYENMVNGLLTADEFTQMKSDYEAKIATLSARADEIRNNKRETEQNASQYRDLASAVSAVIANDTLTAELIDRLVDKILVSPNKSFEVWFKFADAFSEVT
jgi:DNA invertase Pin-like site-specific DNA recombinase